MLPAFAPQHLVVIVIVIIILLLLKAMRHVERGRIQSRCNWALSATQAAASLKAPCLSRVAEATRRKCGQRG